MESYRLLQTLRYPGMTYLLGLETDTRLSQIHYPMAFLGIVAAGAVFAGLNPSYTTFELAHAIRTADITHLLVEPEFLPKAVRAAKECSIPESHIFAFDTLGQTIPRDLRARSWNVLQVQGEEMDWDVFDDRRRSQETIVARLFSSGTTGLPKALNVSTWNLVRILLSFRSDNRLHWHCIDRTTYSSDGGQSETI